MTRTCHKHFGLCGIARNMLRLAKTCSPQFLHTFETSKRFSLSKTWRTNLTSHESLRGLACPRHANQPNSRCGPHHPQHPEGHRTRAGQFSTGAGGWEKNGPAQLEPKWQDQFLITTILSKLVAVTEAVDQEFCVTPFILPPHLNLP